MRKNSEKTFDFDAVVASGAVNEPSDDILAMEEAELEGFEEEDEELSEAAEGEDASSDDEKEESEEEFAESNARDLDINKVYIREMYRIPLLTAEQERALGERILAGRVAEEQLAEASDEVRAQLETIIADALSARNEMVEHNLRLAYYHARKYSEIYKVSVLDLAQAGNEGLIVAAEKFDVVRGFKFSTYASWWIRQAITRYLDNNVSSVKVSVHLCELQRRINKLENRYSVEYNRKPTDEEVARELHVKLEKIRSARNVNRSVASLDATVDEDESSSLMDFVANEASLNPERELLRKDLKASLEKVLNKLPEKDKYIISSRYGVMGHKQKTLEELGDEFNVCRERIRQIEKKIMKDIRDDEKLSSLIEPYRVGV